MMKKNYYYQPEIEIIHVTPLCALCVSGGGENDNLGGDGTGGSQGKGRAPKF